MAAAATLSPLVVAVAAAIAVALFPADAACVDMVDA